MEAEIRMIQPPEAGRGKEAFSPGDFRGSVPCEEKRGLRGDGGPVKDHLGECHFSGWASPGPESRTGEEKEVVL